MESGGEMGSLKVNIACVNLGWSLTLWVKIVYQGKRGFLAG